MGIKPAQLSTHVQTFRLCVVVLRSCISSRLWSHSLVASLFEWIFIFSKNGREIVFPSPPVCSISHDWTIFFLPSAQVRDEKSGQIFLFARKKKPTQTRVLDDAKPPLPPPPHEMGKGLTQGAGSIKGRGEIIIKNFNRKKIRFVFFFYCFCCSRCRLLETMIYRGNAIWPLLPFVIRQTIVLKSNSFHVFHKRKVCVFCA